MFTLILGILSINWMKYNFFFLNLLGHNVTFQSETGHLISTGSKTTDFYVKYNTGLEWVHSADFLRN